MAESDILWWPPPQGEKVASRVTDGVGGEVSSWIGAPECTECGYAHTSSRNVLYLLVTVSKQSKTFMNMEYGVCRVPSKYTINTYINTS